MSDVQREAGSGERGRGRGYTAVVRTAKGPWRERQVGTTAREAKRRLAKELGLPVRWADSLPLGRSPVSAGQWAEVRVEERR